MFSSSNRIAKGSALVGVMLVASTLGAEAYTVSRCNVQAGGEFVPVLMVEVNGERSVHRLGEEGLTRSILFDPQAALAWAMSKYGGASSWSVAGPCFGEGNWTGPIANEDEDIQGDGYPV